MQNVKNIEESYDENRILKDEFIAVLEDGVKVIITNTDWETAGRKKEVSGGVEFDDKYYFTTEQIAQIPANKYKV